VTSGPIWTAHDITVERCGRSGCDRAGIVRRGRGNAVDRNTFNVFLEVLRASGSDAIRQRMGEMMVASLATSTTNCRASTRHCALDWSLHRWPAGGLPGR
jgi:hypothetical protein